MSRYVRGTKPFGYAKSLKDCFLLQRARRVRQHAREI